MSPESWTFAGSWWLEYSTEYGFRGLSWFVAAVGLAFFSWRYALDAGWLDAVGGALRRNALPVVVTAALLSAAASLGVAHWWLGEVPHLIDELCHVFQARVFLAGELGAPVPPPPLDEALDNYFLVRHEGRWHSKYQPLFALVLAGAWSLGLRALLNPALNAAGLLLTWVALRRAFPPERAAGGALLMAASPFFFFMGASLMGHPLSLLLSLLVLLGSDLWLRERRLAGLVALSLGTGLFAAERPWTGLFVAGPAFLVVLRDLVRRWSGLRPALGVALALAVPLGACLAPLGWYQLQVTGSATVMPRQLGNPLDAPGFGSQRAESQSRVVGYNVWIGLHNLGVVLATLSDDLWGWPGLCLVLPLVGLLSPPRERRSDPLVLLARLTVPSLFLAYFLYFYPALAYGARYYYEVLPHAVVLTLLGVERLAGADPTRLRAAAASCAVLTVVGLATYVPVRLPLFTGYGGVAADAREMAERPELRGHAVLVPAGDDPMHLWFSFAAFNDPFLKQSPLFVRDLPALTPEVLRRLLPDLRPMKLRFRPKSAPQPEP